MGTKSNYWAKRSLDNYHNTDRTGPATIYTRIYTVAPSITSAGTEVSTSVWTNYSPVQTARNTTNWPVATGSGIASLSNGVQLSYGVATTTGNIPVVGFANSDATGNIGYQGWMGETIKAFTGAAATDLITCTAHGYSDGEAICFDPDGATLPTGITGGIVYYVRDSSANTFKVATTSGGSAVNITADGSGNMRRCYIIQNGQPVSFEIGTLVITEI